MMDFNAGLPSKHEKHEPRKRRSNLGLWIALIVTATIAVASMATAVVFILKYNDLKKDPSISAQKTKQQIVDKVGALYDVPNEDPTLARVSDQEKLSKEQEFFKNAKDGDYILVYPQAKLGILYRESTNKIINIGPVSTQEGSGAQSGTADETQ